MSSVTHLTQYLLKLDPQKSVARQSFYNYLKNFCEPTAPLNAQVIHKYVLYVLNHQYWQQNAKTLGESLLSDLSDFSQRERLDFNLQDVRWPHQMQTVALEHQEDLEFLLKQKEQELLEPGGRLKVLPISDSQSMVLILDRSGGLRIRIFKKVCLIREGRLELLAPLTDLTYTSNLELYPNTPQILEGPMLIAARFQITDDGCFGLMVRGHMLQKYETLTGGELMQHPELFYSLKRIERHFVNPTSDPFYRDLVTQLEKVYQMLTAQMPEGKRLAPSLLQKGKTALKNIFPNDKLLMVLVTNIEFALMALEKDTWTKTETHP